MTARLGDLSMIHDVINSGLTIIVQRLDLGHGSKVLETVLHCGCPIIEITPQDALNGYG